MRGIPNKSIFVLTQSHEVQKLFSGALFFVSFVALCEHVLGVIRLGR
jgi:hypothetical protein